MNNKKKSNVPIILMVVVAILMTGCATTATDIQINGNENSYIRYVEEDSTLPTIIAIPSETLDEIESEGSERVTEGDLIISRFHGRIDIEDGLVLYDITIKQLAEYQYIMDLQFYDYASKELVQQLIYIIRDSFMPDTISNPIQVIDVNNDGSDDLIIDLGIYGKARSSVCYVYEPNQKCCIELAGSGELMSPEYITSQGIVIERWRGDATEYGLNKYRIEENKLILVASLYIKYGITTSPAYTEKILINGDMITVKENVSLAEIDSKEWYNLIP